jgi:hypothetical protein
MKGGDRTMTLSFRTILVMAMLAVAVIVMTTSALAASNGDGTKPGWGFGDKNHVHTGPPGQSVHP